MLLNLYWSYNDKQNRDRPQPGMNRTTLLSLSPRNPRSANTALPGFSEYQFYHGATDI